MLRTSFALRPALLLIVLTGCGSSLQLHEKSPAHLVRSVELSEAGLPYRDAKGNIVLMQWKDGITFVQYDDSLNPLESFSVPLPDGVKYVSGCLTARNKYVLIGAREKNDVLDIDGIGIDLSSRTIYKTVPLLKGLSWKELQALHAIFVEWNSDSTRFVTAVRRENHQKQYSRIQGVIYDEDLNLVEEFIELYEWPRENPISTQELIFDQYGNVGVVRIEKGKDRHRIVYQQASGRHKVRVESTVPAAVGGDSVYIRQTKSFVDSANHLHTAASMFHDYELLGFASVVADLDRPSHVTGDVLLIPREEARTILGKEKAYHYRMHSPFQFNDGSVGFLAEQLYSTSVQFESPAVWQTTTTVVSDGTSLGTRSYDRKQLISPGSTKQMDYDWYGSVVLLTLGDSGAISVLPLVTNRGKWLDAPITKILGQFLLHGNDVVLPTTVHRLGGDHSVVYAIDGKDLYYVQLRSDGQTADSPQPLTHISGAIGLTWSNAIARYRDDVMVIPALSSLFGKGTLLALRLP